MQLRLEFNAEEWCVHEVTDFGEGIGFHVDENGNFCVDVEGCDLSDAFKQAIMAVAKI